MSTRLTRRQVEREVRQIADLYHQDPASPRVQETLAFLRQTDERAAAASAARARREFEGVGRYDEQLHEDENRAAGIRLQADRWARELATRRRSYARKASRPTPANLSSRVVDLEQLRSWTLGEERAGYERDLAAARSELAQRTARRR